MAHKITIDELKSLLSLYDAKKDPICLWGRPSTGKTTTFREYAKEQAEKLGLKFSEDPLEVGPDVYSFLTIIPSQFDPVDFIGMMETVEVAGSKVTLFNPAACFPRQGQGIFFIDEISNAAPDVLASLQRLILEGRMENYVMPAGFWRVAAGNREEDMCNTNELGAAFLRRTAHFDVDLSNDEVVTYFMEHGVDPRVTAYLKKFAGEDLFPKFQDERLLQRKSNPYPHTWNKVGQMIANETDLKLIEHIACSWVGDEAGIRFVAFCKSINRLDVDALLLDPVNELTKLDTDPDRPSLLYALVTIVVQRWRDKDTKVTAEKVLNLIDAMVQVKMTEFAMFLLKSLFQVKPRVIMLTKQPNFYAIATKIGFFYSQD